MPNMVAHLAGPVIIRDEIVTHLTLSLHRLTLREGGGYEIRGITRFGFGNPNHHTEGPIPVAAITEDDAIKAFEEYADLCNCKPGEDSGHLNLTSYPTQRC
jgi:hypothetical protein